jgi:murein DD-endopeptidase MepM/ murein hydrolase activator NlpD
MTDCAELFVKRNVVRFALTGLVGIWLSGCSADTSRFAGGNPFANGNPFGNPFSTASNDAAAPTPRVAATPLASANPSYVASAHPNPVAVSALPAPTAPAATGQIRPPASQPVQGSAVGWTAVGGSPVIVAEGDSLNSLSQRYGVPVAALMGANGLNSPSQIHGGMRIVVPVYNSRGRTEATPVAMARESRPEAAEAGSARAARKADREVAEASDDAARSKAKKKLEREAAEASDDAARSKAKKKLEREAADVSDDAARSKAKKKPEREAADASDDAAGSKAKKKLEREVADASDDAAKSKAKKKLEREAADASDDAAKSKAKKKVAETVKTPAPVATTVAKLEPPKAAPKKGAVDPTPIGNVRGAGTPATAPLTGAQADASGVAPEFRWPARGRIIQGFKSGGNDGINISVPEGTSVRAAENGTVAYAGSELKGYGNLVLIRHPNGFVSAYANNGELDVKRGDVVKRGQVIAKSGQSGNVSSPQLHFELRKGSTPVDPTSYLAGL